MDRTYKVLCASIAANVVLLVGTGYLFNRTPEQVITTVVEEKVVTKVEVQTVTEYKDKIVYKDRIVVERIVAADGTTTERTISESEGSKDTSVSTAQSRTASSETSNSQSTSVVTSPTILSRYSLGVRYSLAPISKTLTPDFKSGNVIIEADARIGNLPIFLGVFASLDGSMYGLGIRLEL